VARKRWSNGQIAAVSVAGVVAFVAIVIWVFSLILGGGAVNPLSGKSFWVNPDTSAANAAASTSGSDAAAFAGLAAVPTATWLLPEKHPTNEVGGFVSGLVDAADAASAIPIFTIYGIPDRDCSNQSAGGTTLEDYPNWVAAIADGIGNRDAVIILEPDSLALTGECGGVDARTALISSAVDTLVKHPGLVVYLDGGHSTWLPAAEQADLLNKAGISKARGFATNVSNFNALDLEITYGNEVSSLTGGSHYVIDTSRNGNGGNGDWCNPSGRKIGEQPSVVEDGSPRDANLWVKAPGESDGACNGGPASGEWWPSGALALVYG
jgi:endoglucanase